MNRKNLKNMLTNERRNEVAALLTVLFCLGYAALLTSETARTIVEYTLVGTLCLMVVWFVYSLMRDALEQLGKK
jgi:ABC-type arginine/histidine transport system permease subunit